MAITWWSSPAKLNLFLHINGRYDNGYHQLQTVFQLLDVGDEIGIEINTTGQLAMATPVPGVSDEENLILRAATLLQQNSGSNLGASLHVRKRLPMGGGVGGGSSNAATTLLALNKLWHAEVSQHTLLEIGQQLGADVPVFINGETTFAEGTGNIFTPIQTPEKWFLVVHPNVHVSTQAIFTHPDLPRSTPLIDANNYQFESTRNDCQEIVCELHSQVANLLRWLLQFAPSRMTGTGACVFAVFSDQKKAENVLQKLPNEWAGFVAKGVQQSPLLQQLNP